MACARCTVTEVGERCRGCTAVLSLIDFCIILLGMRQGASSRTVIEVVAILTLTRVCGRILQQV